MAIFENKTGTDNPFDGVNVSANSAPSFADLDGDGDLDAFIGEVTNNLNFYRNEGGTFTEVTGADNPFNGVNVGSYSTPSFADVDGDGDLDAFIGERYGNLNFYRNDSGTFTSVTGTNNPFNGVNVGRYSAPSFADVDGDGDLDAFIGGYGGNLNFYRNEGGTFTQVTGADNPFNGVNVGNYSTPSFADVDGDGDLDAFIGEQNGNLNFYRNDSGTFTEVTGVDNPFNGVNVGFRSAPSFADVDGDGDLDALIGESDGILNFYENTTPIATIAPGTTPSEVGTTATPGTFIVTLSEAAPAGGITISYTVGGTATSGTDYTALSGTVTVAAGATTATIDVTPILDAVTDPGETVEVTLTATPTSNYNLGDTATAVLGIADETPTTFTEVTGADNPFNGVDVGFRSAPSLVDLDGDGDLDALIGESDGNLNFYRNEGGTFTSVTGADNPFHGVDVGTRSAPSFADLDGDGDLDALIGEWNGNLNFYRNEGGTFTEVTGADNPFHGVDVGFGSVPSFADLDGDGDLDALIGEFYGNLNFYRNEGGTFTEVTGTDNPFNGVDVGNNNFPSFADVDGDGDLDALIGERDGNLNFYRNEGGTFTEVTGADNPFNGVDVGLRSAPSFADVDGDGDLDAFIGETDGTLKFYENAPTATITAGITPTEDGTTGTFTFTLSDPAPDSGIVLNYTVAGTATSGTDYTTLSGTVTVAAGETTATVDVTAIDDGITDPGETVEVTLTDGAGYNLGTTTTAELTITDGLVLASIAPGTIPSEVGTTATPGTFIVTLSEAAPAGGITIPYTVGGTATSGTDYTALSGTVTVAAGATTATIDVTPILDTVTDPGETVEVTLTATATSNYNLGDTATAVLGIADETPTTFTERIGADNPFNGVDVGFGSTPSFADLDGDGDLDAFIGESINNINFYRNEDGTFTEVTGAENPFNGVNVGNWSTPSFADVDGDGDLDAFIGTAGGQIHLYRNESGTFTRVTGADNPFNGVDVGNWSTPSFADVDGDGDLDAFIGGLNGNLNFYRNEGGTFTRVTGAENPFHGVNVGDLSAPSFADVDGDGDLDALIGEGNGNLNFYRNESGTFTRVTGADNPFNGVDVGSWSAPSFADVDGDGDLDALIGEYDGTLNFYENAPTATVAAGITPTEDGTTGTFVITLSEAAPDSGIVVDYTVAGTVTSDTDYTTLSGTVTVAAGETTATVDVTAIDDGITDPGETVEVMLTDGAGYNLGTTTTAELTITDGLLLASIAPGTTPSEVGTTATPGTFIVTLTEAAPVGGITISYTVGGTATSGTDYTALSGTVTVAAGATTASIDVTPILDTVTDPSETVEVTLTDGATYNLGDTAIAVLRIADETPTTFTAQTGTDNPFDGIDVGNRSASSLADVDGDGDLDALIGEQNGNLNFYRNDDGAFTAVTGADNPFNGVDVGSFSAPSLADVDGDGDLDALIGEYDGTLNFYRNDDGAFTAVTGADNPFNGVDVRARSTPSLTDVDGDGDLDVFIGEFDGNLNFYRNEGGTFTEVTGADNPFNGVNVGVMSAPSFADVDGDGDLDALIGEVDGTLNFYRNDSGTFTEVTGAENPFHGVNVGLFTIPSLADVDGDGDLDALIGERDGTLKFYENAPTATVAAGITPTEDGTTGTFTFTLSNRAPDSGIVLNYTVAGTATSGTDYTTLSGTVTVAAGETTATVDVAAIDDALIDPGETVSVTLTDGAAYNLGTTTTAELTITDNDAAGFTLSKTIATVDESGTSDSFTVVLDAQPTSNVVILVSSDDTGEVVGTPTTLTFTPANWDTAQTVTLTGVDDNLDDGNANTTVTLEIDDVNSDDNFDALGNQTVTVTTNDDDTAGFTLSKTTATVDESGTSDSFSVVLDAQPTSDVVILVSSDDTGEATTNPTTLTFTPGNWDTAQTVTLTGVDDNLDDGDRTSTVTVSIDDANSDDNFDALGNQTVTVTTNDDDTAGFTLSRTTATVDESGTSDSFSVVLDAQPTSDVVITVSSDDTGEVVGTPTTLTFTPANWDTAQTVTVTGIDDDLDDGNANTTITLEIDDANSDNDFDALGNQTVTVTTNDDDTAGVTIGTTNVNATEGGATGSYTVVLDAQPTDDVTVSFTTDSEVEAIGALTFTPANWDTPQTVTVTATDETNIDGNTTSTIAHSTSGGGYDGVTIEDVTATIVDNDSPNVAIAESDGNTEVGEDGTADSYELSLTSTPSGDVTITVTAADGVEVSGDNTSFGSTADVLFTNANGINPLTVYVRAIDDDDAEGTLSGSITHAITASDDTNYPTTLDIGSVIPTITDNDIAYELSLDTSRWDEGNSGSQTIDFTITRSGAIDETSTVDFTLGGTASDGSDYNNLTVSGTDISEADGTITFEAGSQTAIVSVEILGDAIVEPDETLILTLDNATASGTATLTTDSLTASILNDDTAGVILSTTTLEVAEGGTTADYTVRLTSQPTGVVTLGFNTGTQLEAIEEISFTPTNWNIPQTVTIEAIDDLEIEGEHSGSISHNLVGGDYDGVSVGEIAVTLTDNDNRPETPISDDSETINSVLTPLTTPTSNPPENSIPASSNAAPAPPIESDLCHLLTNPPSFPNLNPTTNTLTGASLIGDDNHNTLDGTAETQVTMVGWHGNDNLLGSPGDDVMFANRGTDVIDAGMGNDAVFAGQDDDAARGGLGSDLIAGDFGSDRLWGNEDGDVIFGNAGDDYINGGVGNDLIFAGKDNDVAVGGDGGDIVAGDIGSDCLHGQAGNDILFGNAENDILDGGEGNDLLFGGKDNDTLLGGLGSDLLFGDLGNDLLTGGAGGDRFDFRFGDGSDIITDFEDGIDLIGLQEGLTFTDLAIAQVGNDTQITATGLVITLQGVNVGAIDSADFALI